jgi:hypothetical protein
MRRSILALLSIAAGVALAHCASSADQVPRTGGFTLGTQFTDYHLPDGRLVRLPNGISSGHGWLSSEAKTGDGLLYVTNAISSSGGAVVIFKQSGQNQQPIGEITQGVSVPFDVFVDSQKNLYVANSAGNGDSGTITVYRPGTTAPFETLTGAGNPNAVVVDTKGNVFVSNCGKCGSGSPHRSTIIEYLKGHSEPSKTLLKFKGNDGANGASGLAIDSSNNLFAAYVHPVAKHYIPQGGVLEFAAEAPGGKKLSLRVGYTGGLTIDDKNNLLLVDQYLDSYFPGNTIDIFPPGAKSPIKKYSSGDNGIYGIAINKANSDFWVTNPYSGIVYRVTYPGGDFQDTISANLGFVTGVATSPDGSK